MYNHCVSVVEFLNNSCDILVKVPVWPVHINCQYSFNWFFIFAIINRTAFLISLSNSSLLVSTNVTVFFFCMLIN